MAIRYSGNVEVRMKWSSKTKRVRIYMTDGSARYRFYVRKSKRPAPEEYDRLAALGLAKARRHGLRPIVKNGRIYLRRLFQAPCSLDS